MITNEDAKNIFNGDGTTTSFPFTWKVQAADDLRVVHVSTTGVETALTYNTHFSVTLNPNQDTNPGGAVTYPKPPLTGTLLTNEKLVVQRGDNLTQPSDVPGSTLLEEALDKVTALVQQVKLLASRALVVGESETSPTTYLGTAVQRANKFLSFDASGNPSLASVPTLPLTEQAVLDVLTGSGVGSEIWPRTAAEIAAGVTPVSYLYKPGKLRRYGVVGTGNEQAAIQNALNSGEKVIDGEWIACTSNSSLTVPAEVEFKNFNITAGASGINLLLVNTGCTLRGKLTGTGTTSTVERLVYPAAQAVTDVTLDVEVTNATYGVHAQPTSGTAVADRPKRWKGRIYCHDIVGTVAASEGYGVLLSPAEDCDFIIHAKNIARHALYLSAGARYNKATLHVNDCDNYAVQIYSTSAQDATEHNEVTIFAQNLDETVAGQGGALAIVQKAHRNKVAVHHDGDGTTSFSVLIEGASGGPYPLGNEISGTITGQFTGIDVIKMLNADSTKILPGTDIRAYATSAVIGMRRTGTNGSVHGGYIEGVMIDCQGQAIKGIYNEINAQPSYIGPCDIRNNSSATRVDDQSGGYREGYSREVTITGTTASITAGATGDTSAALLRAIDTTRRSVTVRITDSSVDATGLIRRIGTPADATHVDFRILNEGGSNQTFSYEATVRGD